MKTFVEYYETPRCSCGCGRMNESGEPQPACGDRSVVQLDGRRSITNLIADAIECNGHRRPVYPAFRIIRGESLLRAKPLTKLIHTKGLKECSSET